MISREAHYMYIVTTSIFYFYIHCMYIYIPICYMVAKLFRSLRVDAIVEPTRLFLFTDAAEGC